MPLKSEQQQTKSKKNRHQSSNVFPDGFRVKDTVKRKIMGRLRASSHSSASSTNNDKNTKTRYTASLGDGAGKTKKDPRNHKISSQVI